MNKKLIFLLIFIGYPLFCPGQETDKRDRSMIYLGGKAQYGFIIPHAEELKPISKKNFWGFQVDISKLSLRPEAWSNCNCYYRLGLSFNYFDYRNPSVLGESYNLILFFEPYLNFQSPFRVSLRGGMGLNYLNRVYDEDTNPENLFYSSKISGILLLNLSLNYLINKRLQAKLGLNYNHISNGGIKMPNKGMNFPAISLGMDYLLNPVKLIPREKEPGLLDKKFNPYSRLFFNMRTVEAVANYPEEKKMMLGLETGVIKGLTNINGLLAGIEVIYDDSYKEMDRRLDEEFSPFVLSLHLGHAFVIGRITFTQQMAYYAFASYPGKEHNFYQRYGLYYRIGNMLSAGFSLKSHGHVAEHMDLRLGIEF